MFYVKEPLKDGVYVTVEINDADLVGTAVLCDECAEGWMELHGKQSET